MNIAMRTGIPTLCYLMAGLLIVLPGCQQKPQSHTDDVKRLVVDEKAPSYYDQKFKPVPPEELAKIKLPESKPYTLGQGDIVEVSLLNPEQVTGLAPNTQLRVKTDGSLRMPVIQRVEAEGKTILEVEEVIAEKLKDYITSPAVSLDVLGYNSKKFYVVGEVGEPAALPVDGTTTLLQALINVGGTKLETADLKEAYVVRDYEAFPFSIESIVMQGHPHGRLVMAPNDIVYVPHVKDRADYVYIFGSVGSPQRIPMDHSEGPRGTKGNLSLADALAMAGGLNPETADINGIHVYRGDWTCPREFTIGAHEVYKYGNCIHLRPGDRIFVSQSGRADFNQTIAPTLVIISAVSSLLSLTLSAIALSDR